MKNLNNLSKLHVFFIGIGGVSMSGLAKIVLNSGGKVSGSDINNSQEIQNLKDLGADIYLSHNENNVSSDIDVVIYSSAIASDNKEMIKAKTLNIPILERSEFLGFVSQTYKNVIAIAGTHGKTTTTSLIGEIFTLAGLSPTIHIGGKSNKLKSNTIIGEKNYFIVEACEYKDSFRYLKPQLGIITNIEADHLDFYKNYRDVREAFERFASKSEKIISLHSDNMVHKNNQIIYEDWCVKNIEFVCNGYNFNVYFKNKFIGEFRLNLLGQHNITNSLFAIATAYNYGIDIETIKDAVSGFMGVERRYEKIHTFGSNCNLIIDYAHHPTEIKSSIDGIKSVYNKILCVFQPHTFSRTKQLFSEFINILEEIGDLVLYKTYPARENEIDGGSAEDLFRFLIKKASNQKDKEKNKLVRYFNNIEDIIKFIGAYHENYDCILVLGAGDLAEKLRTKYNNA